jgi:hypothetical protein
MLFLLPIDLLRFILKFLTLNELGLFDRVIVSHSPRSQFLEALRGHEILLLEKISCNARILHWLTTRHISVSTIVISEYISSSCLPLILQNKLSLQNIKFLETCDGVDQEVLCALSQCAHLDSLSFSLCHQINDESVQLLLEPQGDPKARKMKSLKSLEFVNCSSLTNQTALHIALFCASLQHLNLSGFVHLSDLEIEAIVQGCPQLASLDLSRTAITEVSVRRILDSYPQLHTLILSNCVGVSNALKVTALRMISLPQIYSTVPELQLLGTISLRKAFSDGCFPILSPCLQSLHLLFNLLTEIHFPIDEVVELGVVSRLIELLSLSNTPV